MPEARCETPGMHTVVPYWADTNTNKISLAGIFALFSCLRKYDPLATFFLPISAT